MIGRIIRAAFRCWRCKGTGMLWKPPTHVPFVQGGGDYRAWIDRKRRPPWPPTELEMIKRSGTNGR